MTKSKDLTKVQEHYQDYPYPFRDPEEETNRLLVLAGEYLGELNHWLYKGKQDFKKGFRILIAGGGTGDCSTFLGEQLKDYGAEIVYLDFSKPSMEIAQQRAEKRGIKNIRWINDSIFNIPNLQLGKFDYINCSGVLHHLSSPPEGLKILKDHLKEDGGMEIMVYGKIGRTAIYHMQDIMKMVNEGIDNRVLEVMNFKLTFNNLPPTNWAMRAKDTIPDVYNFGDIGIYDMFLHKQDRAYTIPELYEFIGSAGLNIVEFFDVTERLALRIENYITDFTLLQRIKRMSKITQQAIAELIVGNVIKHSICVSGQNDTIASLDDLDNVPYFYGVPGLADKICEFIDSTPVTPGNTLHLTLSTPYTKDVKVAIPTSNYTKSIFKHMIGETKSLGEIFDAVREELQQNMPNEKLINDAKRAFNDLFVAGVMLLRDKSIPAFKNFLH